MGNAGEGKPFAFENEEAQPSVSTVPAGPANSNDSWCCALRLAS